MGLVKQSLRIIPYAAVFLLGYYVGTIESGKHDTVFCTPPRSGLEERIQEDQPILVTEEGEEVIAWKPAYK